METKKHVVYVVNQSLFEPKIPNAENSARVNAICSKNSACNLLLPYDKLLLHTFSEQELKRAYKDTPGTLEEDKNLITALFNRTVSFMELSIATSTQPTAPSTQPTATSTQPTATSTQPTAPSTQPTATSTSSVLESIKGERNLKRIKQLSAEEEKEQAENKKEETNNGVILETKSLSAEDKCAKMNLDVFAKTMGIHHLTDKTKCIEYVKTI